MKPKRTQLFRFFLALIILSFAFFFSSQTTFAREVIGDCNDQAGREDCIANGGVCDGNVCVVTYKSQQVPYASLQEEVETCEANGSTSLGCYLAGDDTFYDSTFNYLNLRIYGPMPKNGQAYDPSKGTIGIISMLTGSLLTSPPASSVDYFADVGRNLSIIKPAYAAALPGVGFTGFVNLLPIWKASRNISYIAFIVAFLYFGLAIMFRLKISAQAVITIQNAIPKLVIGLILVSFSYAIAGLVIDLMYVVLYIGLAAFASTGLIPETTAQLQLEYTNLNITGVFGKIFDSITSAFGRSLPVSSGILGAFGALIGGILAFASVIAIPVILPIIAGAAALPFLILGIIVVYVCFKLFFNLLNCYVAIIISIITAPIQIAVGTFSGQNTFKTWLFNLIGNVMVFPAVIMVILLIYTLGKNQAAPTWSPPGLSIAANFIPAIISVGIFFQLPKIPEIVKNAFKIKNTDYGSAIGETFKPATQGVKSLAGGALEDYAKNFGGAGAAGKFSLTRGLLGGLSKLV